MFASLADGICWISLYILCLDQRLVFVDHKRYNICKLDEGGLCRIYVWKNRKLYFIPSKWSCVHETRRTMDLNTKHVIYNGKTRPTKITLYTLLRRGIFILYSTLFIFTFYVCFNGLSNYLVLGKLFNIFNNTDPHPLYSQLLVLQVLINAHLHYFNVFFMRLHAHRKTQVLLAIVLSVLLLLVIVLSVLLLLAIVLSVLLLLAIVLSVLRFTASVYHFSISKLFFLLNNIICFRQPLL